MKSSQTYDGRRDSERSVAVAFVRRSVTGHVEVFEPTLFRDGERQMRETIQKSLDSIRRN